MSSCGMIELTKKFGVDESSEESTQADYSDSVSSRPSALSKLEMLESQLTSNEFEEYQEYLPYLKTQSDRINFLMIKDPEERKEWLKERGIYQSRSRFSPNIQEAINRRDIVYGMSKDAVKNSWGEPSKVDYAGRGDYERWTYYSNPAMKTDKKYLYFENGVLTGWESL